MPHRTPLSFVPFLAVLALVFLIPLLEPPPARAEKAPPPAGDRADEGAGSEAEPAKPEDTRLTEEIVVSATVAEARRDPVTFTDLDREEIAARNRGQDLAMILGGTPNAYAYSDAGNGVGYSYLRLRGFDQRRVGVYIDGVPLNSPESHQVYFIDLADFAGGLERIQVQRGTGSSLHGIPSVGGVVNLDPGHLEPRRVGRVQLDAGSFGTSRVAFRYGGPLAGGRWAWMVRGARVASDGYRRPSWTRHSFGHLALERFEEDSVLRIDLFGGPEETQLAYYGVTRDMLEDDDLRRVNFLRDGETDNFFQPHLHVHYDRRLREGLFLKNTAYFIASNGFFRQYSETLCDDPEGTLSPGEPCPAERLVSDAWRKRHLDHREAGWIPTVVWDHGKGTLTGGLHLRFHRGQHIGSVTEGYVEGSPIPGTLLLYEYQNDKRTYSAFVREMLRPRPDLAVTVELEATHHEYAMREDAVRGLSFDATYDFLTPRLGVNWNLTDRWNLYASASTGRSEPPFGDVWDPQDSYVDPATRFRRFDPSRNRYSDPYAGPEKLRAVEAGVGWVSGANRFKASLYRMAFRDELVFAGGIDDDGLPITENAGRSIHQGIEIEGSVRLPGEIDLSGFAAASDDRLREFTLTTLQDGQAVEADYSGNRVALFPEHLVRLQIARAFGDVRVLLGARRVGTIYLDNSENERKNPAARQAPDWVDKVIDPFTVADLRLTWNLSRHLGDPLRSLTLDARIENLLDERYAQFGYAYPVDGFDSFYVEFFPGATRAAYVGMAFGF